MVDEIMKELKPWQILAAHATGVVGLLIMPITFPLYIGVVIWMYVRGDDEQRKELLHVAPRYLWACLKFYLTHDLRHGIMDLDRLNLL